MEISFNRKWDPKNQSQQISFEIFLKFNSTMGKDLTRVKLGPVQLHEGMSHESMKGHQLIKWGVGLRTSLLMAEHTLSFIHMHFHKFNNIYRSNSLDQKKYIK